MSVMDQRDHAGYRILDDQQQMVISVGPTPAGPVCACLLGVGFAEAIEREGVLFKRLDMPLRKDYTHAPVDPPSQKFCTLMVEVDPGVVRNISGLCHALSLVLGCCVEWKHWWRVWGGNKPINKMSGVAQWTSNVECKGWPLKWSPSLSAADADKALSLYHSMRDMDSAELRVAVRRWHRSIQRWNQVRNGSLPFGEDFVDSLVDLRVALESVFLGEAGRSFSVALCGAWSLGRNPSERRRYFDALKQAYSHSSRAVHTGRADVQKYLPSLADGQDACRKGLVKWIEGKRRPSGDTLDDMLDLVLG